MHGGPHNSTGTPISNHQTSKFSRFGSKSQFFCGCSEFEVVKVELDPQCAGGLIIPWGPRFQITKHLNLAVLAKAVKFVCGCSEFEVLKVELYPQRTGDLIVPPGPRFQITKHLNLAVLAKAVKFFVGVLNSRF
jgi:hypothetical protein